jgi:hypothetical protein
MERVKAIPKFTKAIAGAVTAGGAALVTAAVDDGIASNEWWIILGSALIGGAAVYETPNFQPKSDG